MTEIEAVRMADRIVAKALEHQTVFPPNGLLSSQATAAAMGAAIATLRATLVAELQKQPYHP
jgi:hypothetical protein